MTFAFKFFPSNKSAGLCCPKFEIAGICKYNESKNKNSINLNSQCNLFSLVFKPIECQEHSQSCITP